MAGYNDIIALKLAEDMDDFEVESEHRKKRRRRLSQRAPALAQLICDDDLQGITIVTSDDLWTNVFGPVKDVLSKALE